jgi:hypothetical protein
MLLDFPHGHFSKGVRRLLLLIVTPIVSLYLVLERFRESYGDLRRKKLRSSGRGSNPRPLLLSRTESLAVDWRIGALLVLPAM